MQISTAGRLVLFSHFRFMERPLPTDKRPEADHEPEFWKEMSGLIVHEGKTGFLLSNRVK